MLDDLERRLAVGAREDWAPPTGLAPLPVELGPRARALVAAQLAAIAGVEEQLQRLRDELATLRRPQSRRPDEGPAYIDTVA